MTNCAVTYHINTYLKRCEEDDIYAENREDWIEQRLPQLMEELKDDSGTVQTAMVNMTMMESDLLNMKRQKGILEFVAEWDRQYKAYYEDECRRVAEKEADEEVFDE